MDQPVDEAKPELRNRPGDGGNNFNLQTIREAITSLISLAIAGIALYLLLDTYNAGKKIAPPAGTPQQKSFDDAYGRQKDLLLYALALLGTVTGYYFGRVPAELHAQKSDRDAHAAREEAQNAREAEDETKRTVRRSLLKAREEDEAAQTHEFASAAVAPGVGRTAPGRAMRREIDRLLEELD